VKRNEPACSFDLATKTNKCFLDSSCTQNRFSAAACTAQRRTIVRLVQPGTMHKRKVTIKHRSFSTMLTPICAFACEHYRGPITVLAQCKQPEQPLHPPQWPATDGIILLIRSSIRNSTLISPPPTVTRGLILGRMSPTGLSEALLGSWDGVCCSTMTSSSPEYSRR
jgi:hypothetical protein